MNRNLALGILRTFLLTLVFVALVAPSALAQEGDLPNNTVFDQAGVLSDAEEREVADAFDRVSEESGSELYAIMTSDTGISSSAPNETKAEFLRQEAAEVGAPDDAGVVLVSTDDRWGLAYNMDRYEADSQAVFDEITPQLSDGDWDGALLTAASEVQSSYDDAQSAVPELLGAGSFLGVLALAGAAFFASRRARLKARERRELEGEREAAEREFGELTGKIDTFNEKERLVAGYLEAQRPLLDQQTEDEVEARIREANASGFGSELNEAALSLNSDPRAARERLKRGRESLEHALAELDGAEETMDHYRAADETLEGRLHVAAEEIDIARTSEASARAAGAAVETLDLRSEYDRLAKEAADREGRRDEFDPRDALGEIEALIQRARERREAMEAEVTSRETLPEERRKARAALQRAEGTLDAYRPEHAAEERQWGPAALETAPSPEELDLKLHRARELIANSDRAEAASRFAEARSMLREAGALSAEVAQAPAGLREALIEADRRKREGEDKLRELEARLARAKKQRHRMSPSQRRQLRDYERRLDDARGGWYGTDWLTTLLIFEALDTDYVMVDSAPDGGDWSDFGGGFGGGDFGGGGFGGGGDFGGGGF
jgi:hypothetical protein